MVTADILSIDDVRARLHCSRRTVFALLADGKLRRVRFGKCTYVGAESVDVLLAPKRSRVVAAR